MLYRLKFLVDKPNESVSKNSNDKKQGQSENEEFELPSSYTNIFLKFILQ